MDEDGTFARELVQLSRLALEGSKEDVCLYIGKLQRKVSKINPDLAQQLLSTISKLPQDITRGATQKSTTFDTGVKYPLDADSRVALIRNSSRARHEPILSDVTRSQIDQIVKERKDCARLLAEGLTPTRSALFVGPPGVGKTLTAQKIADTLGYPLFVLDLSSVISSFLGKTGANLKHVFEFAKSTPSVLLLDEIDAIGKRRDDEVEIGELKRLVTVLLQELDNWTDTSLLIAATNHPSLLDSALWRRFEVCVSFDLPEIEQVESAINLFRGSNLLDDVWQKSLAIALKGGSFNDIERAVINLRRQALINEQRLEERIQNFIKARMESIPHDQRIQLAIELAERTSQRQAKLITGVSRDTIRKNSKHRNLVDGRES